MAMTKKEDATIFRTLFTSFASSSVLAAASQTNQVKLAAASLHPESVSNRLNRQKMTSVQNVDDRHAKFSSLFPILIKIFFLNT